MRAELTADAILARFAASPFANDTSTGQLAATLAENPPRHGDWARWAESLAGLPSSQGATVALDRDAPAVDWTHPPDTADLNAALQGLHPWRKGPWQYGEIRIDSEWRSDMKWARLAAAGIVWTGKRVLDIGGGNSYFAWRCRGAGAAAVLNVDPTVLFYAQHLAFARYAEDDAVCMLPLPFEQLPACDPFDAVLSMGVLYHRRDPLAHLSAAASRLRRGGTLVLETLVVDGDADTVLVPPDRYARMRNVWFLPSVAALRRWLERLGFDAVTLHDQTLTATHEQRSTDWMRFDSLADALDPTTPARTVEGLPAPRRALLSASRAER